MTREDALEALLKQIQDLVRMAKEGKGDLFKNPIEEGVEEKIDAIESAFKIFRLINDEALRLMGESSTDLETVADQIPDYLDARQRKFLEEIKSLRVELEKVQKELDFYRREFRKKGIGKKEKKSKTSRQKRFRNVGGDKGWKPV